jgi:hypothetical protein
MQALIDFYEFRGYNWHQKKLTNKKSRASVRQKPGVRGSQRVVLANAVSQRGEFSAYDGRYFLRVNSEVKALT